MIQKFDGLVLYTRGDVLVPESTLHMMKEELETCEVVSAGTTHGKEKFHLPVFQPEEGVNKFCFLMRERDFSGLEEFGDLVPYVVSERFRKVKYAGFTHVFPSKEIDESTIPKIIHQIWIGGECPYKKYMDSWKQEGWEYKLWTEESIPYLVNQTQFDSIKEFCGKADILRYEILYRYGGIYADADLELVEPIEDHFLNNNAFFCYENEHATKGLIANTIFGVSKHNKIMLEMIESIHGIDNINYKPAWQATGPKLLTEVIRDNHYPTIYPSHLFLPQHHSGRNYGGNGKVYAQHHWNSTER